MGKVLTKAEFFAKHDKKYKGMSTKEKNQRYEDYLESMRDMQSRISKSVSTVPKQRKYANRGKNSSAVLPSSKQEYDEAVARYITQVCTGEDMGAVIPERTPHYPSAPFFIKQFIQLTPTQHGATGVYGCGFQACPKPQRTYNSWTVNPIAGSFNPATLTSSVSQLAAIKDAFGSYRPVSMRMDVEYTGAPLNAKGSIAFGYFSPDEYDQTTVTWSDLVDQHMAKVRPALDGGSVLWIPQGPDSLPFRQTNIRYDVSSADVAQESKDCRDALAYCIEATAAGAPFVNFLASVQTYMVDIPLLWFVGTGLDATASFNITLNIGFEGIANERTLEIGSGAYVGSNKKSEHAGIVDNTASLLKVQGPIAKNAASHANNFGTTVAKEAGGIAKAAAGSALPKLVDVAKRGLGIEGGIGGEIMDIAGTFLGAFL